MLFSMLATCVLLAVQPISPIHSASIEISPEVSLFDQDTTVVVNNLDPGEIVLIQAEAVDDQQIHWGSRASFQSDKNGIINLSVQSPLEGTYSGIDPMGLLWSMQSESNPTASFTTKKNSFSIELKVLRGEQEIASKKIVRLCASQEIKRIPVREDGLVGILFLPPSEKPLPVIITLSGSTGGIGESKSQLLASHGFAVLALGYFGVEGLPPILQDIPLEYFETAFQWLGSQPNLDSSHVGIYGGSRGGELALILGAWFPESVQAIVAAVPSSVIYGVPGGSADSHAWIYHGMPLAPPAHEALPLTLDGIGKDSDHPFNETPGFLEGMKDKESFNTAAIPVEKIRAALLLISGGDDQMWPSALYASQIEERLRKYHSTISWEHLYYPKAGHGITIPYLPQPSATFYHHVAKIWCALGGSLAENRYACQDSWRKTISFFEKHLKEQDRENASSNRR